MNDTLCENECLNEVTDIINEPHISFNGLEFTKFLNFVKSFNIQDKNKNSKLVTLSVEGSTLFCRSFDSVNYFEYQVHIYNEDNLIKDVLVVNINDLSALIKCTSDSRFCIRNNNNQYEFKITGNSWMAFTVSDADPNYFIFTEEVSKLGVLETTSLKNVLNNLLGYIQNSTYPIDNCIKFTNTKAYVTSRFSGVVVLGRFLDFTLMRHEALCLKTLIKDDSDIDVFKSESFNDRLVFSGNNFKFIILSASINPNELEYKKIQNYLTADYDSLVQLSTCAEEYQLSKKSIGLSVKDNNLYLSIKNNLMNNHSSLIKSFASDYMSDYKEIVLNASDFLKNLKVYNSCKGSKINISFTDNFIVLFVDDMQSVIDICN